jgi:hypothetical protein
MASPRVFSVQRNAALPPCDISRAPPVFCFFAGEPREAGLYGQFSTKYSCKVQCGVRLTCRPALGTLRASTNMIKCKGSRMHIGYAIARTRTVSRD